MQIPTIILGLLVSTLYGALFHLWRGGGAGRLLLYLVLSWIGFLVGQIIADLQGWTFASLGSLHLGFATLTNIIFLLAGHWLSLVEVERE